MSRTLFSLLVKHYLRLWGLLLMMVLLIFVVVDFGERLRSFSDKPWSFIAAVYAYKSIVVVHQLSPAAMLLSAGALVSILRRRAEWTAMQAAGMSRLQVIAPVFVSVFSIALLMVLFDDRLVTTAQAQMARFDADKQRAWGSDGRFFFAPTQWFRLGPYFVHLRGRGENPGSMDEVTIYQVDDSFQLLRRFDAQQLTHLEKEGWRLRGVTIREFVGTVPVRSQMVDAYDLVLPRSNAASFDVQLGRPESMTLSALREQIRIRRRSNQPVMAYAWAMHQRFAYPLLGVAAALLSSLLALRSQRSASLTQALAEGLVVMLAVFTLLVASKTLALSQHVSPGVASWVPLALLCGAVALLYRQQETNA